MEISYLIERPEYLIAVVLSALVVIGVILQVIKEDDGDDEDDDPDGGTSVNPGPTAPDRPKASVLS